MSAGVPMKDVLKAARLNEFVVWFENIGSHPPFSYERPKRIIAEWCEDNGIVTHYQALYNGIFFTTREDALLCYLRFN